MHSHYINKLLDIEDVIIKKIKHADTFVKIHLETKPQEQICPCCGAATKRIHDYRYQTIKDLPFQLKHCYLVLHKKLYHYTPLFAILFFTFLKFFFIFRQKTRKVLFP